MTPEQALHALGLAPGATAEAIDQAIASEHRTWTSRTNAPNAELRMDAQRRVRQIMEAEMVLLGDRRSRPAGSTTGPIPGPTTGPIPGPTTGPIPSYGAPTTGPIPPYTAPTTAAYPAPAPTPPPGYGGPAASATAGYWPAPVWQAPPAAPPISKLAIWSLVCSTFLWICGFGGPLGIALGGCALVEINRSNGTKRGKGIAWAGLVIGVVGTLFVFFAGSLG